ncbi:AAEL010686-PA [Aedes aegypti]|uniref:AAEL010686-PA n=1 Tax=Aedes aegypti TaxID=7159 RepID=Q16S67_AEDAE|nr:AAEL010686-PA [Aedes aegypti]
MSFNDIENAVEANQLELAINLISCEWNRLGAPLTIYGIIRSGSVPVLALLRTQKFCSDRDMMVLCTNAFHELQIKQVCIPYDMHLYLLRMFASYGLHHLRGNLDVRQINGGRSLMQSIRLVVQWTEDLRTRKRWYDYLDFDNDVEFRLRMIHNELFFIKDCKELKKIPLKEAIFCVAVFVKSANECPGDFLYKTIINQRNLIQFLVAVYAVMKELQKNGKCCSKRHMLKKITKVYRKLKQIRSVMKLVQNVPAKLDEFSDRDYERAGAPMTIAAMKRFIQVFGEAIKNTPDSPNFPTKLNKMLPVLFHDSLWLNSKYRDLSSHGYPLSCLYMQDFNQIFYYRHLKQYMMLIAISSLVFTVYIFLDCTQNLFGLMRRTTSIEDVRSLVRYAGNSKLNANQKILFRNIFRFLEYCIHQLDLDTDSNDQTIKETKDRYLQKQILVEDLNEVHRDIEKHMTMVEIAAFANSSVQYIHALIDSMLQTFLSKDSFRRIISQWRTGETMKSDYFTRTAISMQRYIHLNIELDQIYSDEKRYQEETDKIFAHFTKEHTAVNENSNKLKSELHESLINGYYHNIFGIDHKAQAITKTLKSHFTGAKDSPGFKSRNREFKSILDKIRINDEIQLESEYRRVIRCIRNIFIENDCSTFETFCLHFRKIPLKHRLALEYWQMQAMEMLIKTKYFGDNFGTLKCFIPIVWGKTYRNYLAHDSLSYDLITVSNPYRIFVNGFVLAFDSDDLKIFSRACNLDLQGFTRIDKQGFEWIDIQANLLKAYRQRNQADIDNFLQMNADTWGRFYCPAGKFLKHRLCSIAEVLAHDTPYINPTAVELSMSDPIYSHIIHRAEINTNLLLNLEQFDCIDIVDAIEQFKYFQPELVNPCLGAALKYLVANGSFSSSQELLEDYGDFAEQILNVIMNQGADTSIPAEICTTQNWLFIVRSNNLETFRVAVGYHRDSLKEPVLSGIMKACCMSGRLEMVKILLSHGVPKECVQTMVAIHHRRWNIIKHLLNSGTDPWHDDGILMFASVIEHNFKLLRRIVRKSFPSEFHHDILRCVARRGSLSLFKFVINRVENMWQCVNLLGCALSNTDSEVVRFLLDKIFYSIETSVESPVLRNWAKTMNELLYQHCIETNRTHSSDGVHVFNFPDIDGYTPLCHAVRVCNFKAVEYILQNGADPSIASPEGKAGILQDAILNRSEQMIILLLSHSPQLIHEPVNTDLNESALEKAAQINHCRLTSLFLENGADLSHRNVQGMTAVEVAIQEHSLEALQVLLEYSKTVGEWNTDSITALNYANNWEDLDTVKFLEEYIKSNKR